MPKFKVTIEEHYTKEIIVEAESLEEAEEEVETNYICGDIKHHDYFNSQEGILLIDAGHFETEIAIKDLFFSVFSKKIPNFVVYLAKTDKSPINYF